MMTPREKEAFRRAAMIEPTDEEVRLKFEAWIDVSPYARFSYPPRKYLDAHVQDMWEAWCTAIAAYEFTQKQVRQKNDAEQWRAHMNSILTARIDID